MDHRFRGGALYHGERPTKARRVIPLKDDLPTSRPAVLTVGLIGANVAVFLVSPAASFVHGAALAVDGGMIKGTF